MSDRVDVAVERMRKMSMASESRLAAQRQEEAKLMPFAPTLPSTSRRLAGDRRGSIFERQLEAGKAQQAALENNRSGQVASWRNPDTGHSGTITPKPAVQTASGEYCRGYEHEIKVDGRTEVVQGTACRNPDGTWRVIN